MSDRFQNDPPANCAGVTLLPDCSRCDRLNPFGGEFEPALIAVSSARCLSLSTRHPRPDYVEAQV